MARIEIKISHIQKPVCPYCNTRPLLIKTCGHFFCQFKHRILLKRTYRKTDQKRPSRQIEIK